jgi:hypothetical protein
MLMVLSISGALCAATVQRGRNEALVTTRASNVLGNRNLAAYAATRSSLFEQRLSALLLAGGSIGVAEIVQLSGQASLVDFREIGPLQAHLQITLPGNDRLRFFGLAVSGDLYLGTALDTLSLNAQSDKPIYTPELLASVIVDLDWLALFKRVPLKTYLEVGLADEPQLLHRYAQLSVKAGLEWKMYQHSIFLETGAGLYREKRNRLNMTGDRRYEQMYVWLQPGARYRIRERVSLLGAIGLTVASKQKDTDPFTPRLLKAALGVEMPIVFRETNAEAIRTLVFMEQFKVQAEQMQEARARENAGPRSGLISEFDASLSELGQQGESFDYKQEQQKLRQRRREVQQKMEQIERMLSEIEE